MCCIDILLRRPCFRRSHHLLLGVRRGFRLVEFSASRTEPPTPARKPSQLSAARRERLPLMMAWLMAFQHQFCQKDNLGENILVAFLKSSTYFRKLFLTNPQQIMPAYPPGSFTKNFGWNISPPGLNRLKLGTEGTIATTFAQAREPNAALIG